MKYNTFYNCPPISQPNYLNDHNVYGRKLISSCIPIQFFFIFMIDLTII